MWWETLFANPFLVVVIVLALIFCGVELYKAIKFIADIIRGKVKKEINQEQESVDIKKEFDALHKRFDVLEERMGGAETRLDALTESDMHDIKSWIVEQYHKFVIQQGWIDAFSAETIDRRYEDYKKEGGNSYIDTLIEKLHTLSMDPDLEKKNKNE